MTIRTFKRNPDSIRCYKNCDKVRSSYINLIEERLLKIVLEELKKLKYKFEYKKDSANNDTEINVLKNTLQAKNNQLNTLNLQKNKLYDLLEQEVYSNSTFLDRMNTLSHKIESVTDDIENLQAKLSSIDSNENMKDILHWIDRTIESIENIYWNLDVKQRNEFLKTIIDKVIYKKDRNAGKEDFELEVYLKKYI